MSTLEQIEELLKELREDEVFKTMTCDKLSRVEVKIAILMASLTDDIADAKKVTNDKGALLKFKMADENFKAKKMFIDRGTKPTIPDINATVELNIKDDKLEENVAIRNSDKLLKLWEALEKIINALKDRLKVLMREQELSKNI